MEKKSHIFLEKSWQSLYACVVHFFIVVIHKFWKQCVQLSPDYLWVFSWNGKQQIAHLGDTDTQGSFSRIWSGAYSHLLHNLC